MIDYALAKELKDAGFPQNDANATSYIEGILCPPTLSELIEACWKIGSFDSLTYLGEDEYSSWGVDSDGCERDGRGTSPEEAVARLWLALHNPKHVERTN
jgi:hypothetical protein